MNSQAPSHPFTFCEHEIRIFEKLKAVGFNPQVIYDIGASNGYWSVAVSTVVFPNAQYHLFEPSVDEIAEYKDLMYKSIKEHKNFTLHKVALGNTNGTIEMYLSPTGAGNTTLNMGQTSVYLPRKIEVPVRTLQRIMEEKKLPSPQLVKIDVQATEDKILRGAKWIIPQVELFVIECWMSKGYGPETPLVSEIITMLEAEGFTLIEIGNCFYNDEHKIDALDCYFLRNDLVKQWKGKLPAGAW